MKKLAISISLFLSCLCILIMAYLAINTVILNTQRRNNQENLAKLLGVQIEDYPSPYSFPSGYFSTMLKQGASIESVHQLVQGYEIVLHCGRREEVYYYYSSQIDDPHIVRFKIVYDEQGYFRSLEGEDSNSRTIRTIGCEPGVIPLKKGDD